YGAARSVERIESIRARRAVLVGLGALMLAEYASMPIALQPIPTRTPPVYADLLRDRGDSPDAVIVEYPTSDRPQPNMALHDATYMFYSTAHWQKLLNGYSGFFPASYLEF